jgi:hypothetical protein
MEQEQLDCNNHGQCLYEQQLIARRQMKIESKQEASVVAHRKQAHLRGKNQYFSVVQKAAQGNTLLRHAK